MAPRTRQPWDELLPDGRTVAEALAAITAEPGRTDEFAPYKGTSPPPGSWMGDAPPAAVLPGGRPMATTIPAAGPATVVDAPLTPPSNALRSFSPYDPKYKVFTGTRTTGLSPLGKLLAQQNEQRTAAPSSQVRTTAEGIEVTPPATRGETNSGKSRFKQALIGLLQGAATGGQGGAWSALGGAAAGAAAGGISPQLMQAFTRDQEVQRTQRDIEREMKNTMGVAQIGETMAQAEQRRQQPELEALRIEQQRTRDAATAADRTTRSAEAAKANATRAKTLEETMRHNKAVEGKVTKRVPRALNGQFWEEDDAGVMRVKKGSPPPTPSAAEDRRGEKSADRTAKGVQAGKLYERGAEYWDQAQNKRKEADNLPRSTPNRDERTARLYREAASLEAKTRDVQLKGDELATESESEPATKTGRTIEGAISAFRTDKKREPTAAEIARMQAALNK